MEIGAVKYIKQKSTFSPNKNTAKFLMYNMFSLITVCKMQDHGNLKRKIIEDEKDETERKQNKKIPKEENELFSMLDLPNEIILRIASFLTLKDLVSKFLNKTG